MDSGLASDSVAPAETSASITVARPTQTIPIIAELRQIAEAGGKSYLALIRDFAKLAFGPGKLAFDEYLALRLFDEAGLAGGDKRAFVGLAASRKIWLEANYQIEYFSLVENKIAANALFGAYGFPVIPTLALFSNRAGIPTANLLRTEEELRHFLIRGRHYPMFGKPMDGIQSLGAASFDRYDTATDSLVGGHGFTTPLDSFVADVANHYGSGYLFQHRMSPHSEVRALCGDRLATVRLLTILTQAGPKLLRACWKIPAGSNVADNFWRSGNMLAQLDLAEGRVLRVVRGAGTAAQEPTHHPDTGARMIGFVIPNWRQIVDLALEGAKVLPEVALIGWDIASVDTGSVLVELNHNPDFKLTQIADRCGTMDAAMKEFLAERRSAAEAWKRAAKQNLKHKETVLEA
jgi:Sugar-transfer associated ATP-grasp